MMGLSMQVCRGLQYPLFLQEDQDDWLVPNFLLLWLHCHVLFGIRHHVWSSGIPGLIHLCAPHLQKHKVRLA